MKKKSISALLWKTLLTGLLLFFASSRLSAQAVTNYTFATSTGTFTALTSPVNPTLSAGDVDDGYFNNISIGFDFWYMGTRYTSISASTNGWLTFGASITDASFTRDIASGGTPRPVIAPLWDDLGIQVATNVSYLVTGSSPNRIFTIQYLNARWRYTASGNTISFQTKLYEGTGKIEFIYKPEAGALSSASAHIGITAAATGSGNFLSVNNAGTSVNSTTPQNVTSKPVSGKKYAFTPPVPTTPGSLTFSGVTGSSMTLNWSDLSSNERGFVIYRSTDGVNYSFVSQTAAGATSSVQSGLTAGTTYYWKVYAVSEGGLSTALSGNQTTTQLVLSNWLYRKAITIDYTKVGAGPHTNFPMLISRTDTDLQTKAQTDGDDILFIAADGVTKLDHQIENYTSATGTLVAWVKIPSLSSTANTVIYMYYGNASATSQQNATGTWDANFKGVWHLNNAFTDATSNANNGTNTGTTAATGKISGGSGFVRSDGADYVTVPGLMGSPTSFTLSAWATLTTADPNAAEIISIGDYSLLRYDEAGVNKTSGVVYNGASVWTTTPSGINYAGTGWHYVVYTFDDAGNSQKVYVDGAQVATTSATASPVYTGGGTNTFIGKHGNGNINFDFDGTIDEARVAGVSRSAGWVLTEYNNQNSPSTFYSVDGENCQLNISQHPTSNLIAYYKFNGNANDTTNNNNGTFQGGTPTQTPDRFTITNKAYTFNGTTNYISTANPYVNPGAFSVSIWFKTTTTVGGVLTGFSSVQTGNGGNRDRFIYMTSTGILYFGVAPGAVKKYISTTAAYNDGNWHQAISTMGAGGLKLYVDGSLAASDATVTSAESYTGYWRIGHDDIATWPNEPVSYYFQGTLDDATIYHRELTSTEVGTLYNSPDGAGNNGPVCAGTLLTLTATTSSGATYSWTGPNSFTASSQNPTLTYSAAAAGVYTVQVTGPGCSTSATAYTTVISTTTAGQWIGNVSTDWATGSNWCNGVVPTSTTDVIISAGATNMPIISSSVNCKNLTINASATVTLGSGGTLNIAGTLTNNGTFTNSGTVNFDGTTGQQTFSGVASFYNLTLNNTAGLLLPAAITVNNNLTLSAGTLNANNFNVTVKGNWTNNVSTTAFTAGTATATFNGTTAQAIGGSFATTFNNLTIASTGVTVTLTSTINISDNLSISSGTFDLAGFTANRTSAGGTLTVSNNATLKIGGTNTYPTNYTTNTLVVASNVEYAGANQTVANQLYGNLILSSSAGAAVKTFPGSALTVVGNLSSTLGAGTAVSFTAASDITVNGNVSLGASTTFNGGSYSHSIGGNWVNNGTFTGNSSTITFTGAGATVSGSGTQHFNNLTVAAAMINFSAGSITLTGNLATTGSGSFTQASGGTLLMTGSGATISGSGISLDNLTISGTVSTTIALNLTGNLSVSGSFTASTGTITMSGASKTMSGAGFKSFSALSVAGIITTDADFSISSGLAVSGSLTASAGTATFTGTATVSGTANLFNVTINGTSLQLASNATLGIANVMTITAGTLNVTSSAPNTVNFNGAGAQNINAITYDNLTLSNGDSKTALAGITVNNNITIAVGTTFIPGAFTHSIYSDWNNSGSFTAGAGTIQFLGNESSIINGVTTFNILTANKTTAATNIILQSNITASTVNMVSGTMLTGTNTLTITTTRTGNGIILGHIQRTHAFTTGVAYAFEGPDNTINFSAASSVTSVTVSVTEGPIGDFPFGGSISRVYNIAVPAGTYTATLRLHYDDDELNGNTEASMGLWNYNGSAWVAIGKTANNTTSNYVEQSGLTSITNRWTCSDNSNVVQWNGSVSTDWNTAANWTVLQGSASSPPSATDIVNLGTVAFTYHPTISNTVSVKNINFGSVQALTLSMASGGSLTSGDIHGTWGANATHTINANDQSITVNGALSLSDGVSGHAINLTIGSGTVTTGGSLTQSGGANIVFSAAGNLNIGEDYNFISGTFTPGTGTVTYNGVANQVVGAVGYNNLTINKPAAAAVINTTLTIGGNLTLTAGELENFVTSTIAGNVVIASGATLHNDHILHIGGNWTNNGSYTGAGVNVIFDGSGTQSITATTFNNLTINKPVGSSALFAGNMIITGDLTVTSGTLNLQAFDGNRNIQGGAVTVADPGTLIIGANNWPGNYSNYTLANSSTVIFDGTGAQTLLLTGISVGHLTLRNAGVKTLASAITVKGHLTIETGAVFDGGSNTLTLNGHWLNSGTFTPSASTVLCTGTAKNLSGNTTFNKVTVTGSYTILNNVTFNGLLNITSTGSLSGGGTIHTTLHSDLINSGILYTLGTTTFSGNVVQTLSLINAVQTVALIVNYNGTVSPVLNSTSAPQYGYLTINNTGGVQASVGWTIAYSLTVGSGASFNGGASTHNILGAVTNNGSITSSGRLNFVPSSAVTVNLGSNFSSTGTVVFGGAGAMTLGGTTDSLSNVIISNTNGAGITPSSGWSMANNLTVNSGSLLNAGSYSYLVGGNLLNNGTINSGTSTFTLNGTGTQDIYTSSAFNNLTVNKSAGLVTLSANATVNGLLNFITGKIQTGANLLIQPSSGTVTGAAQNTGWVVGNLQKNIATGATNKTFEIGDATSYTPVTVAFASVTTAGDLTASTTAGDHANIGTANINASLSANRNWTLTNSGILFTNYNATFTFVAGDLDGGAVPASFSAGRYSGGSWSYPTVGTTTSTTTQATGLTAFGDFQLGTMLISIKTWDGGAGTNNWGDANNWNTNGVPVASDNVELTGAHSITIDVVAVANNILLNNAGLTLTISSGSLSVNDLTITAGTLNTGSQTVKIAGTVSNSGTLTASSSTVEFNGSAAQTIPAATFSGNAIKNLTINNTAGVTLGGTLDLTGILLVSGGQFTTGGHLTLVSTATQTALIDGSGAGGVSGNVTMQRYLVSGFGYKYFSSPFQGATVDEFSDELNLGAAFPTFYRFDENLLSAGWVNYTNTSGVLNPGEGYAANLGASSAPITVDITGVVNNSTLSLPALYNHNRIYTQGFNLVGNPYPSPIDWDAGSGWSRTNIDNAVYYFNAGSTNQYTGTYSSYINGISSDGTAGNVIAAMQGFFVHVSNGSFPVTASITINNNARINNLVPDFRRRSPLTLPLLRLSAGFTDEKMASDPAVVYFDDADATKAFDREMDALKIMNTDSLVPNLYVVASDTARLSICAWPGLQDSTDIIPLGLQTKRTGWITLQANAIERIPAGKHIYLYDAKTGISQDVQSIPRYRVYLEAGEYKNRFFLAFRGKTLPVSPPAANYAAYMVYNTGSRLYAQISHVPGEKCQVMITNMLGQVLLRKQLSGNGSHELGLPVSSGVYLVSFYTQQGVVSKKISISK